MPKKKKMGKPEEEIENDAFKAGASGKFDEPLEVRGKEVTPAEPVDAKPDGEDVMVETPFDKTQGKPEEKPEVEEATPPTQTEPEVETFSPPSDDFDFLPPKPEKGSKKLLWIVLIVLFLAAFAGGGMYIAQNGMSGLLSLPSPEPSMEATPTPVPELDRSKLNIQVLNGSGVAGTAKTAQEFLEELGYKVGGAGNAKNYDFEKTEISLKEDKMDYKDQIILDLSKKYSVNSEVATLDKTSKFDAVIIIGKSGGGE